MKTKKEKPTIQEKFLTYYDATRSDLKRIWRYEQAVKDWNANESIKPPYTSFRSFYEVYRRSISK